MTEIPELALVVLVGPSGAGKTTFARRHFTEAELGTIENARERLARGELAVVDATNVTSDARKPLVALAHEWFCAPIAIVFDLPERVCLLHNDLRTDRVVPAGTVRHELEELRRSTQLEREGFRVIKLSTLDDLDHTPFVRRKLPCDRRALRGPFDVIGDVHGCRAELERLLSQLGYDATADYRHAGGRTLVFVGDLVDRGPEVDRVVRLVMKLCHEGIALCVLGNHEAKLMKRGIPDDLASFFGGLEPHYVLDGGQLVVAHAGLPEAMHGRSSGAVREHALYGESSGETHDFAPPAAWAEAYRGEALVVHGHTPVRAARFVHNTVCIDTGCVYGGALTALRYPERELVSVPAARSYV